MAPFLEYILFYEAKTNSISHCAKTGLLQKMLWKFHFPRKGVNFLLSNKRQQAFRNLSQTMRVDFGATEFGQNRSE